LQSNVSKISFKRSRPHDFLVVSGATDGKAGMQTPPHGSGSQTFMSRGPFLSLTGEYLIYRDTWVLQYHGEST